MNLTIETPYATFRIMPKNPLHPLLKSVIGFTFQDYKGGSINYSSIPNEHENTLGLSCDWSIIDTTNQSNPTELFNKDLVNLLYPKNTPPGMLARTEVKHKIGNIGLRINRFETSLSIPTNEYAIDYTLNKSVIFSHQYNYFQYESIYNLAKATNSNATGNDFVEVDTDDIEHTIELELPKQYKIRGLENSGDSRHSSQLKHKGQVSYNLDNKLESLKSVKLTLDPETNAPDQEISLFDIVTYYPDRCRLYIRTQLYELKLFVRALHRIRLTYQLKQQFVWDDN